MIDYVVLWDESSVRQRLRASIEAFASLFDVLHKLSGRALYRLQSSTILMAQDAHPERNAVVQALSAINCTYKFAAKGQTSENLLLEQVHTYMSLCVRPKCQLPVVACYSYSPVCVHCVYFLTCLTCTTTPHPNPHTAAEAAHPTLEWRS
jgi:hypothetical protein